VSGALTDREFWEEEYIWSDVRLPSRPDPNFSFDRALMNAFAHHAAPRAGDTVLEIGCAPAKWLVHLAERHGARVQGVEYSPKGADVSRANLAACGLDGAIETADFFAFDAEPVDLVVSLGFIEHFDDTADVFSRHVALVKPRGRLVIGVPNFRGLNGVLQRLGDAPYLALHNRGAMVPALYRDLAARHQLTELFLAHIGGPDPVIVRSRRTPVTALVLAGRRVRRLRITENLNHRWLSSYLLGVWRAPA
jgi:2-polyprenyl-3-methyl-5-hydroxy-6-metoxy-1,4-benzoquinol methylase